MALTTIGSNRGRRVPPSTMCWRGQLSLAGEIEKGAKNRHQLLLVRLA